MKKTMSFLALMSLFAFGACAHKTVISDKVTIKENVVSLNGLWVKDKSSKFDMAVRVTNLSKKTLLVPKGAMQCSKGAIKGTIAKTSLDHVTPHSGWLLSPEESVVFHFTCRGEIKSKGDMTFKIAKIFENKNPDSPDRGSKLAEDVSISAPQD